MDAFHIVLSVFLFFQLLILRNFPNLLQDNYQIKLICIYLSSTWSPNANCRFKCMIGLDERHFPPCWNGGWPLDLRGKQEKKTIWLPVSGKMRLVYSRVHVLSVKRGCLSDAGACSDLAFDHIIKKKQEKIPK